VLLRKQLQRPLESDREKKTVYDKTLADSKANLAAVNKAVAALSAGMAGSFVQTAAAGVLRVVVNAKRDMLTADREELLAFLSNQQGGAYAPASGEILGLVKQMGDEMLKDQQSLVATESGAVKDYDGLMAAKKKEIAILSKSIEEKLARVADLGVEISTMKNDLEDTKEALESDKKFQADLAENCVQKTATHEEEKKGRAEEIVALADTIKILNDDDALELFKKTLPSASASFVQMQASSMSLRAHASKILVEAQARWRPGQSHQHLDFVLLALRGQKVGFEKIIKLVDDLVATLKGEQLDDDHKKEYCEGQFDATDDKKKMLERSVADLETVIEESKEGISTLAEEIKALRASIAALDESVAGATAQRQAESAAYKDLMSSNTAAKELLLFAKNRLNKFYNPRLFKAAPERELSEGDRIYVSEGGDIPTAAPGGIANTGITAFVQISKKMHDAPAPPPATAKAYTKKAQESGGVLAMMDLLIADLDKEMTVAETEEKDAQKDYEKTVADSADKRRQDSKTLTDKESAKADLSSALERSTVDKKSTGKELMGTLRYIQSLHSECDWLMQYFSVRKQARADEVDSLQKARAVLSGADYSFLQKADTARLRKFLHQS
jgi:hypothetical protein